MKISEKKALKIYFEMPLNYFAVMLCVKATEGGKVQANPCETLVFRLCLLQPYAPLRRTRSESVFACPVLSKELLCLVKNLK